MDRLVTLEQLGAGGDGVVGDHRVKVAAPHDVAVARIDRMVRPLQLELPAHPRGPQTVIAVELFEARRQPHLVELVDGAGSQSVPARLFPGERLALDHRDVVAVAGQPVSGGGAGRSTADDEHVGDDVAGVRRVPRHVGSGGFVDDDGGGDARQATSAAGSGELQRAALGGGVADVDDLDGGALGVGDPRRIQVGERGTCRQDGVDR